MLGDPAFGPRMSGMPNQKDGLAERQALLAPTRLDSAS